MEKDIQVIKAKAEQIYEKFKTYFVFQVKFGGSIVLILISNKLYSSGGRQNVLGGI